MKNSLPPALSDPGFSIVRALTLESPESGRKAHGRVTYQLTRMKEELESHQEKGEEGLDWVKPDVTLFSLFSYD